MAVQFSNITVDKFGRVVIPKEIRDRIGARPGTEFEIEEQDNVILLKPVQKKAVLIEKDGWLVVQGNPNDPKDVDIVDLIKKDYEERARKQGGW